MILKNNWAKFKPITIYTYESVDYLLLGRINLKNGDVDFKSKKIHGRKRYTQAFNLFNNPLDADKQLLDLFESK